MRRVWAFVFALVGCTKPNPRSCLDGVCDDPRFPFCDVNGDIGGSPGTCIEGRCEPNVIAGCQDDDLVQCNANGTNFDTSTCEFGCQGTDSNASCNLCEPNKATCDGRNIVHCGADGRVESIEECAGTCVVDPTARCTNIVPRYVTNACDMPALAPALVISSSASFDTDLDANCNGGILLQAGGPAICIVRYRAVTIADGVDLRVMGRRALALVGDESVLIAGFLNLSAGDGFNGPGGGTTFSGLTGGGLGAGLGGAGFATPGGHGGSTTATGGANNGGAALGDPASLPILPAGPQSGVNAQATAGDVWGGGGGAATLVACRGSVVVTGEINAGGGGGVAGGALLGGGGGGAGGHVVFQGLTVELTGKLFANGGGGGSGRTFQGVSVRGSDALRGLGAAPGGFVTDGARGGPGGTGSAIPGPGEKQNPAGGTAGGGGGSVGFFQTYTPIGVAAVLTPSMASPMPQPNANIPTH